MNEYNFRTFLPNFMEMIGIFNKLANVICHDNNICPTSVEIVDEELFVTFTSWGTQEYGGDGRFHCPLRYVTMSEKEIWEDRRIIQRKLEEDAAKQKAERQRKERYEQFLKLKEEFEPTNEEKSNGKI